MTDRLSDERWRELSTHLDRALDLDDEERSAWLASLRAEDGALAADLDALLQAHQALRGEGFLEGAAAAPAAARQVSLAGHVVGAYRLRSLLGQGGMGSVWLAERADGRFEGVAAVKLLNASLFGRDGETRFRREGSILARLRHAHIAHLIDAGLTPAGHPYLVLEHVDGQRIDHYCDERRLGLEARIHLFLDVLEAVAHAHANLIVHRDIKPSNVLVTADGQVKLLDFGIAKLLEADGGGGDLAVTREGEAALTPEYAAPEQLTGGDVTTATDVYALGVLLYVLLTGRHPAGERTASPAELVRAIVDAEPQRLSDAATAERPPAGEGMEEMAARRGTSARRLRALLRGDLDNIVAKALKKRVQDRYASAETLAEDLRRHLAHEPVSARADSLAYRAGKFARRRRGAVAAFIAVSLLLGSLVTFYTSRLAAERDRARHQADKAARVSELLKGLLTAADPYQAREKREPTVREILDAGAERMARDLAAQPELQAEMLTVMGSVYQRLGAHEKAKPLLEQAVASGRRAPGPQHELVAQSLHELGIVLREKGDTEAAAALLQEALALRRRLGPQDSRIADTLQELAYLEDLRGGGRFETYAREALDIRRQALGEEHRDTVSSLNDLGLYLLLNKGEVASAEPLLRQCLAINRKLLRPDHPDVGTAMGNLALALQAKGDFAQAESLARQGLSISRKALGDDHLDIGIKLFNLAKALRSQGKFAEAAAALEEALRITRPALGPDHSRTVLFTVSLALVRLDQDRAAEAEPMLRHALRVRERTLAKDDARLGQVKSALGAVLTKLARYEEAESLLLAAERILAGGKAGGWEAQEARSNRTRLAALYEAWGRPDQAAPYRRLPSS